MVKSHISLELLACEAGESLFLGKVNAEQRNVCGGEAQPMNWMLTSLLIGSQHGSFEEICTVSAFHDARFRKVITEKMIEQCRHITMVRS